VARWDGALDVARMRDVLERRASRDVIAEV
jgi:hypothetical protein